MLYWERVAESHSVSDIAVLQQHDKHVRENRQFHQGSTPFDFFVHAVALPCTTHDIPTASHGVVGVA